MSNTDNNKFKYIIDEFADCKVLRYQTPDWDSLSLRQKQYIYCLSEAALWGRDIYFDQNFKENLQIRKILEQILENYPSDKDCEEWKQFEVYAKRFFFSSGLHHHYGEKKFFPECSKAFFEKLLNDYCEKDTGDNTANYLLDIIYNEDIAPVRRSQETKKDIVKTSSVNFYENISREEAEQYYNSIEIDYERPVSLGINSKLIKENNEIKEQVAKVGGMYSFYIEKIIYWLEEALKFTENDKQKQHTEKLIEFYKTGDLKTWDEYNILWSQETEGICDYINGFIETYNDPLGMKATWEAVVDYKDIEATKRTKTICDNAQWFEDHSPIKDVYRKAKVSGLSAKVINAIMLAGDCYPPAPIGINLPNADWIRKEYGSKSVTIANLSDAHFYAAMESPKGALKEFAFSEQEIERVRQYGQLSDNLHTDMHECLGHGSGQLLPFTSSNALKEYSSTLEEARADLFALYYLMDEKMIELGLIPSLEVGKAQYDSYIRNGLMTQLARIPLGEKVSEAHMQDRKLISEYAWENGKGCVEKTIKDGKTYFVVKDYEQLRETFGELLYKIQDIKSRGDYQQGKELVETYGVNIDYELHKEVLERYTSLGIKPYSGFVNPILSVVKDKNNNVVDIKVSYPDSFLEQQLYYGKEYTYKTK
ncbi:MAG: dihydrofolate reductase [Bacteroidales bacterium]|nr:dihydrofolate reductase [Candidatus Scybalousia scybalohippi]